MPETTILLVEDEKIIARDLQSFLQRSGYRVPVVASTGEEAVIKADLIKPDLALMDIVLPGSIDGIEAARQICKTNQIPVIYLTAYGDQGILERAKNTEPIGYIIKPYDERELLATIEIALHQFIASRERSAEAMLKRQTYFRSLIENSSDVITVVSRDGTLLYTSPSMENVFGYIPEEMIGANLFKFIHPEDIDRVREVIQIAIFNQNTSQQVDYRFLHQNGNWRHVGSVGKFQPGENGEVIGILNSRDISRRKEAELTLRRSNRALRMISICNQVIVRARNEDALLNQICQILVESGGYRLAWVGYAEQNKAKTIRPAAYCGFEEGYLEQLNLTWANTKRGRGPSGTCIRTGQPSICRDILNDSRFIPWREQALVRGYASSIALPFLADGNSFGHIAIYSTEPNAFDDEEVNLLQELANDLAFGIMTLRTKEMQIRSEQELRTSEKKYRALFETMSEGVIMIAPDGQIVEANPAAEGILGLRRSKIIKRNFVAPAWKIIRPDGTPMPPEEMAGPRAMKEMRPIMDVVMGVEHPDGSVAWINVNASPIISAAGELDGAVGTFADITTRKLAEERLRRSETDLANAQRIASIGNWSYNIKTNTISWSEELHRIFEIEKAEFDGKLESFLNCIHPDDKACVIEANNGAIKKAEPFEIDYRIMTLSGQLKHVHEIGHSIKNVKGELVGLFGTTQDITEKKIAEEKIKLHTARVEALARTANRLNAKLNLENVLQAICEETRRALNVSAVVIFLSDERECFLNIAALEGLPEKYKENYIPTKFETYEKYSKLMGDTIIVPDCQAEPDLPNHGLYAEFNIRTAASVSLKRNGKLLGTLTALTTGIIREFTQDEIDLLKGIGDQASTALTNASLYQEINNKAAQLGLLYDAGLALNSKLKSQDQLEFLFKIAMDTLNADCAAYFRFDPVEDAFQFQFNLGYEEECTQVFHQKATNLSAENSALGWVKENRMPLYIPDVTQDSRYIAIKPNIQSGLWVPISRGEKMLGVINLSSTVKVDAFSPQDERLLVLFSNQAAVALENGQLFEEVNQRLSNIQALRNVDQFITASFDLPLTLKAILEETTSQLGVDAADILLFKSNSLTLEYAAGQGFRTTALQHTRLRLGEGYAGMAALEQRTIMIPNLNDELNGLEKSPSLANEEFVAYVSVPLIAKGNIKGVMELFHRSPLRSSPPWDSFLEALAGQTAIAIDNANLFSELQRSNIELTLAYDTTLEGWSRALELRDKETLGHSKRVTEMTIALARLMEVTEEKLVHIHRGVLLHDIGKMGIPDSILLKPGPLSEVEWIEMHKHPQHAFDLLNSIAFLRSALDIPYCHHEKWDGSGYPRGLKEEQIPLSARIFAVVDVWDALTSDRPYRPAWSGEEALEYIRQQAGRHFDPRVVQIFIKNQGNLLALRR